MMHEIIQLNKLKTSILGFTKGNTFSLHNTAELAPKYVTEWRFYGHMSPGQSTLVFRAYYFPLLIINHCILPNYTSALKPQQLLMQAIHYMTQEFLGVFLPVERSQSNSS